MLCILLCFFTVFHGTWQVKGQIQASHWISQTSTTSATWLYISKQAYNEHYVISTGDSNNKLIILHVVYMIWRVKKKNREKPADALERRNRIGDEYSDGCRCNV